MRLNDYELVISFTMPCYLYIEGESKEKFYVDEQTCDYQLFGCQYIIKTEQLSRNGNIDDVISDAVLKCYKTDIKDNEIHIDKISCKENNENINFIDVITINKGNFDV